MRNETCAIVGTVGAFLTRIAIAKSKIVNIAVEAKLSRFSGIVGNPIWVMAYQKDPKSIARLKLNV